MDNLQSQSCPETFSNSEHNNHPSNEEDGKVSPLLDLNELDPYSATSGDMVDNLDLCDNEEIENIILEPEQYILGEFEQLPSQIKEGIQNFSNMNISNENTVSKPATDTRFLPIQEENPLEIRDLGYPPPISDHEEIGNHLNIFGSENCATKLDLMKANMRDYVETFTSTLHHQIEVRSSSSIVADSSEKYTAVIDVRSPENFSNMNILSTKLSDSVENYTLPSTQTFSGSSLPVNEQDSPENLNKFQSNCGIQEHSIVERKTERFTCNVCQREFQTPSDLKAHMDIHLEKPHRCDICEKSFIKKYNLKAHVRRHTNNKQFECKTCRKSFTQMSSLKTHVRIHTADKPFMCTTCGKSFTRMYYLETHVRVHTGEKPFVCKTCKKSFSQNSHLKTHELVHTSKKPFVCESCGKSFTQKCDLQKHARVHTGETPFSCETCGKSFKQKGNLKTHARVHLT